MGYPVQFWVFDEKKIANFLKELKDMELEEFFDKYKNFEYIEKLKDKYKQEELMGFKNNKLRGHGTLIQDLVRLSGAESFDIWELSKLEFVNFYDSFEETSSDKKGFGVIEHLLHGGPREMLGLAIEDDTIGAIWGYADPRMIEDEGEDAIVLLEDLKIKPENKKLFADEKHEITESTIKAYERAREQMITALKRAKYQKYSIALF